MMIIKKYFSPQLSIAISILAASGCFAAIPNYYYERDKRIEYAPPQQPRPVKYVATASPQSGYDAVQVVPTGQAPTVAPAIQAIPQNVIKPTRPASPISTTTQASPISAKKKGDLEMEETHRKISAKAPAKPTVAKPSDPLILPPRIVAPTTTESTTGPKAEDYKKRLLAIKESYSVIAERTLQPQPAANDKDDDEGEDDDDDDDEGDDDDEEDEENAKKSVIAMAPPVSKPQVLAVSTPYGDQGQYEEEQDWGNPAESKPQTTTPSSIDLDNQTITPLPEDDGYQFEEEENLEGGLLVSNPRNRDHVAQVEGRREEARDVREATRVPGNPSESSTINTSHIRRSRVPKTSVQSERQRQATNSLRTRLARTENEEQPLYYEDYLDSIADQYEETKKTEATPARKTYTKPRRRPVSRDNEETAAVNVVPTQRVSTQSTRNHLKAVDAQNYADQRDLEQESARERLRRKKKIVREKADAQDANDTSRYIDTNRYDESKRFYDKSNDRAVPRAETPAAPTVRTQAKPAPIRTLSVYTPQSKTDVNKTYIPAHQSIKPQPVTAQAPEDDESDEDDEADADLTTDRDDRPNWYDRMDAQRHERGVQRRVRALDGEDPRPRGYPTIPEYTQGNTTPKS